MSSGSSIFPLIYLSNCLTWLVWHGWLASQKEMFYSLIALAHDDVLASVHVGFNILAAVDVVAEVYREICSRGEA
jgi:hypothetical protein